MEEKRPGVFAILYRKIRRNLVILFVLSSLTVINILVLVLLDNRFDATKRDLLLRDEDFGRQMEEARRIALKIPGIAIPDPDSDREVPLEALTPVHGVYRGRHQGKPVLVPMSLARFDLVPQIEAILHDIVASEGNILFRAEFLPCLNADPRVISATPLAMVENYDKFVRLNDFSNNLFSLRYQNLAQLPMGQLGNLRVYYTSPRNAAWMPALVMEYRLYAIGVLTFGLLLFAVMFRKVLLPLKRVAGGLDHMRRRKISLIEHPWAGIEWAFNDLARNTLVTQFDQALSTLATDSANAPEDRVDPAGNLIRKVPAIIRATLPFSRVHFLRFDDIEKRLTVVETPSAAGEAEETARYFDADASALRAFFEDSKVHIVSEGEMENYGYSLEMPRPYAITLVICDKRIMGVLLVAGPEGQAIGPRDVPFLQAVNRSVENAILKVAARRLMIDREKNEISINLSTNMGHDLTNIIATSKWDIETIRRAWDRGLVVFQGDETKKRYFTDAISGLLNNTRMLQEIVNIYRAFGFAKRPQYEWTDISMLVNDVCSLYQASTSHRVEIDSRVSADLPTFWVEPRLLQLAVFNLVSNAAQATLRRFELEGISGEAILIEIAASRENAGLVISVRDQGTGFRDGSGRLLSGRELDRIFRYGYTTKTDNTGSGLGLSWVETIIKEFHQGEIIPRNRDTVGAEMRLIIPGRRPEDTVPERE